MGVHMRVFKSFFQNKLKYGKMLYADTINAENREELRQWHFQRVK